MQSEICSRQNLLMAALTGFTFSVVFLYYVIQPGFTPLASGQVRSELASYNGQYEVNPELPARLMIPGIKVDSADKPVCLDPNRVTSIQKGLDDLSGQRPKENSNIIIAGYYGTWVNGKGSVLPMVDAVDFPKQEPASSGPPVRLIIPKINVDAVIEPMGTTSSGAMEIPSGPRNVGWYKDGPHPGDNGSAVIDGHYGRWKNGEGSVFDDLNNLEKGDVLYVEDENGVATTFLVRESQSFDPNADASDVFESNDGNSHLNLITCEGVWNKTAKSYSQRLVVFTDKE